MLTSVAYGSPRISGPIPYAWVFVVVVLALIALIFMRVYGGRDQSGRQAGHHSRRRTAHRSAQRTEHGASRAPEHGADHGHQAGQGHQAGHGQQAAAKRQPKRP